MEYYYLLGAPRVLLRVVIYCVHRQLHHFAELVLSIREFGCLRVIGRECAIHSRAAHDRISSRTFRIVECHDHGIRELTLILGTQRILPLLAIICSKILVATLCKFGFLNVLSVMH